MTTPELSDEPLVLEPFDLNPPPQPESEPVPSSMILKEIFETLLFTFFVIWLVKTATQNFRIDGESMLPTLTHGEYLIINKLSYFFDEPERGDIVVHHYPRNRSQDFIKRIIGLPGDTVSISNGEVRVNGVLLDEPYIKDPPNNNNSWTIPADSYFVMGDNRLGSSDSRNWSYVPEADIIGQAWVVYWPISEWQVVEHTPHDYVPDSVDIETE